MPRKWTIWAVVALLLLFALPTGAHAQGNTGVTMEATALYEGTTKYGEWLPVVVTLTNAGADARGYVEIRVAGSDATASYAQIVELPRGARKAVTLYAVPNNFARRMVISFRPDGSDKALTETEVAVRPVPTIRYVVAGITGGGTGLEALAGINFRGGDQEDKAVIVPLSLSQIPDRPEALRTLDLLVITGVDTSSLTPRQQAALEQYVALGGVLVLGGGPDASRVLAGLPDSIRPVTLGGEQQADSLPGLGAVTNEAVRVNGPFTLAQATPNANAIVRYREGDTPLVVEQGIGDGAVLWMALDPSLSPFDAWAGVGSFWQQVVGARAYYPAQLPPDVAPRQMQTNDLFYALQNLPSLDLPSLRLLIPVLGIYILLVGPVNYFVLRRSRRLELAWVTIPALTLLFSLGSYGLGYGLRGSDVIVNQVALIRGLEGGDSAYIRSLVGIFSPSRRSYDLAVEGDVLLSPTTIEYDPFTGAPVEALDARLVQGNPALAQGLEVNQWSLRSVLAESFAPEGYGFTTTLATKDGQLTGTVTNKGTHIWKDALVILGTQFVRLGDVAPGESKEVTLKPDPNAFRDIYQLPYKIFETQLNQPNPPRDAQVKQQILSTLFTGSYSMEMGTSLALSRNPVLLAWLDDASLRVRLNDDDRTNSVSTSLFYSPLTMDYQTGEVSFIQGTIETLLVENTGSFCYAPTMASLSPDFSSAEIEFRLPIAAENLDPTELSIYVTSDGMFAEPTVSLLNVASGAWEPLDKIKQGENKVPNPDVYITREGTFRMQVENGQRFGGSCLFFDASLDGILTAPALSS